MFLNRVPMDGFSITRATGLFIHVCLVEYPKSCPPTYGEKHKVTVHGAPHKWKAYIQLGVAWFPKGVVGVT